MTVTDKAIDKANQEILTRIHTIRAVCKNTLGINELLYLIYILRVDVSARLYSKDFISNKQINLYAETYKYLLGSILKFAKLDFNDYQTSIINTDFINSLVSMVFNINANHELKSSLTLYDDITFIGENDRYIKIDMSQTINDPIKNRYRQYISRVASLNNIKQMNHINYAQLLEDFKTDYAPYNSFLKQEFGMNSEEIAYALNEIFQIAFNDMNETLDLLPSLEDGSTDYEHPETFTLIAKSFIFEEKVILKLFTKQLLSKLTFDKKKFDEYQLGYHQIVKQPLIKIDNKFIISLDILLDSLNNTFHYMLLNSINSEQKYKNKYSNLFLDQISNIAKQYHYDEYKRGFELYKSKKNKLGDIDLVLYNEHENQYILIEAKNHALPLSIYFGNYQALKKHLEKLQLEWEKQVYNRDKYLQQHPELFGTAYKYIIVSNAPEILSHFSDYFVLTLNEFEFYLQNIHTITRVEDIFDTVYYQEQLNDNELQLMRRMSNIIDPKEINF